MKNYFILTTLLATALFSGCSNEDEPNAPVQGTPITFTIDNNGVMTKTNTTEENSTYKTTFNAEDQIGVYATAADGVLATQSPNNIQYQVNSTGTAITSTSPILMNTGTATFYAYSPYTSSSTDATATAVTFTVKTDQTLVDNFNASNFLTGRQEVTVANETNQTSDNLSFSARLALLRVALSGEFGKQATAVSVKAKNKVTWTFATEPGDNDADIAVDDNSSDNIKMFKQSDENANEAVFTAFVPAQTINSGKTMLNITIEDRNYVYTPSEDKNLLAGKVNKLGLEIGADPIGISAGLISEITWADNTLAENTPPSLINNLVLEGTEIGTYGNNPYSIEEGKWVLSTKLANFDATGTVSDGVYTVVVTTTASSGSWANNSLFYRNLQKFELSRTYTLSFNVQSETEGSITIYALCPVSDSSTLPYQIDNNYFKTISTTTSPAPASITINPAKLGDKIGSGVIWSDNIENNSFAIVFMFHAATSTTYTISDVKLQANSTTN